MEKIEVPACRGKVGGGLMEHDVRVACSTADIETGQLLIIKSSLCPITFCNDKCINIGHFPNISVFYAVICNEFLNADSGLFFYHAA